jgi:hypothetical protein
LRGVVDVSTEDSNKYVLIPATRFNRQLTGEVRCRWIVAETVRIKGGHSREVGSRESHKEGVDERRDARAREGWKGGILVERRFLRTRSRWPRAVERDWGGLRRKSLMIKPRILIYPRWMVKEGGVGRGAESARDISGERGVFEIGDCENL